MVISFSSFAPLHTNQQNKNKTSFRKIFSSLRSSLPFVSICNYSILESGQDDIGCSTTPHSKVVAGRKRHRSEQSGVVKLVPKQDTLSSFYCTIGRNNLHPKQRTNQKLKHSTWMKNVWTYEVFVSNFLRLNGDESPRGNTHHIHGIF